MIVSYCEAEKPVLERIDSRRNLSLASSHLIPMVRAVSVCDRCDGIVRSVEGRKKRERCKGEQRAL